MSSQWAGVAAVFLPTKLREAAEMRRLLEYDLEARGGIEAVQRAKQTALTTGLTYEAALRDELRRAASCAVTPRPGHSYQSIAVVERNVGTEVDLQAAIAQSGVYFAEDLDEPVFAPFDDPSTLAADSAAEAVGLNRRPGESDVELLARVAYVSVPPAGERR